jgi:hypothetical protein
MDRNLRRITLSAKITFLPRRHLAAQLTGSGKAFDELMGLPNPAPLNLPYDVRPMSS